MCVNLNGKFLIYIQKRLHVLNQLVFCVYMQLQGNKSPRLGDIATVILEELKNSSPSFGAGSDSAQVRHIVEGLLAHYFSLHQSSYHPEDIRWLLEMANLQTHWQATYLMSEIVEVRCVCVCRCACL